MTTQSGPPFLHYQEPTFDPNGDWIVFEAVGKGSDLTQRGSLMKVKTDNTMFALGFVSDITPRRSVERRLQAEFAVTRVFSGIQPTGDMHLGMMGGTAPGGT